MFTPQMPRDPRLHRRRLARDARPAITAATGSSHGRGEGAHAVVRRAATLRCTAIDKPQKPVIASVNGFAVGGNVLQVVCDLTSMKKWKRQVGLMMAA
jgi:1,4-dihydroxy-2-naphthoyl-CoA synthase